MGKSFQILDHPADLGIEACGADLREAFEAAAEGLISLMVDINTVSASGSRQIEVESEDLEQLLVKWLGEILYLFDGEKFISAEFIVKQLHRNGLSAEVFGEKLSLEKHVTRIDVKAITYHQVQVSETREGGRVRVFLDI